MSDAAVRALAPRIAALEPLGRSIKCRVWAARLDDRAVVAKVLEHRDPVWRWYFEREIRVLGRLLGTPGIPALIAADAGAGVMILERLDGVPLARRRRVRDAVDSRVIESALAIAGLAAGLDALDPGPPPGPIRRTMRRRLLEDPTAPRAWFLEGIDRCRSLGILQAADAEHLAEVLASAETAGQHGDLLPRNILAGSRVSVIDWECAGTHLRDWDRALLWANLTAAGRARIDEGITSPGRRRVFRALCAFALAREVKFARSGSPGRARLEADLAVALK